MQAAYHEASALGAVTAWYRDVQRKHAAAGLGDDPIIASILPGSSKKLSQRNTPPDRDAQTEQPDVSALPFWCRQPHATGGSHSHLLRQQQGICRSTRLALG